jgi:hypothetical protein
VLQRSASAPKADARVTALRRFAISITVFNLAGHLLLGFEQSYLTPIAGILTGYAAELVLETLDARAAGRPARYRGSPTQFADFLLPAHIAGLACAMLLYGNESLWPTVFAVTVAVASKYLIQAPVGGRLRHVLNPSNFGISVTLICFSWVGIAPPYHFTENVAGWLDWLIPIAIGTSGALLNAKLTRRMPLILGWLGGFVVQALLRTVLLDHSLAAALLPMTGVAFILFTNYMITDPGTTPSAPRRQVVFGAATALVYGVLVVSHITFGLFFALVIVCIARLCGLLALGVRRRRGGGAVPAEPVAGAPVAADHPPHRVVAPTGANV